MSNRNVQLQLAQQIVANGRELENLLHDVESSDQCLPFNEWTTPQLRREARRLDIPKYERMDRVELIVNISDAWA